MGRLSDKVDQRRLVYYTAPISTVLSLVLFLIDMRAVTWCATLVYVAVTFTTYGLIVSHVHDRTEAHLRVAISATLLVLFSFGGMTGTISRIGRDDAGRAERPVPFQRDLMRALALRARRALGLSIRSHAVKSEA